MAVSQIELIIPTIDKSSSKRLVPLAERAQLDERSRLTLINNGKPGARHLLESVGEALRGDGRIGHVTVFTKSSASEVVDSETVEMLMESSDAVVTGLGDCGACSACSLLDALRMEAAGTPSTVIISDVFVSHIASFAASSGAPGYHFSTVPHPVASCSDEQISGYAEGIANQILEQISVSVIQRS